MSRSYITAGIADLTPVSDALTTWAHAAGEAESTARLTLASLMLVQLRQHVEFERIVWDAANEDAPNVVGLFEHRARRVNHPCVSDDAPVHGIPRPYPWRSDDAQALAREEHKREREQGDIA